MGMAETFLINILFCCLFILFLLSIEHNWQLLNIEPILILTSSMLPVVFISKNSSEAKKIIAYPNSSSNTTTTLVPVSSTIQIIKSKAALIDMIDYLSTLPNQLRISTITLLYAAALAFIVVYIQSIISGIEIFSGLITGTLLSSLPPVKPKRLTKKERGEIVLPENPSIIGPALRSPDAGTPECFLT